MTIRVTLSLGSFGNGRDHAYHPVYNRFYIPFVHFKLVVRTCGGSMLAAVQSSCPDCKLGNYTQKIWFTMDQCLEELQSLLADLHCPQHGPAFQEKSVMPKDDLKLQRERLRNCLIVEERKAWSVVKLKREREKQERRELHSQQLELSDLHNSRRRLHHYGWIPWKKVLLSSRLLEKWALSHSATSLLRRTLLAWKSLMSSKEKETLTYKKLLHLRAVFFRKRWQQKICWSAWHLAHKAEKQCQQALLAVCFSALKETCSFSAAKYKADLEKAWREWVQHVNVVRGVNLMKALASERVADEHAQRTLQTNVFQSWYEAAKTFRLEKAKIRRRAEAWCKIQSWLNELSQPPGEGSKAA